MLQHSSMLTSPPPTRVQHMYPRALFGIQSLPLADQSLRPRSELFFLRRRRHRRMGTMLRRKPSAIGTEEDTNLGSSYSLRVLECHSHAGLGAVGISESTSVGLVHVSRLCSQATLLAARAACIIITGCSTDPSNLDIWYLDYTVRCVSRSHAGLCGSEWRWGRTIPGGVAEILKCVWSFPDNLIQSNHHHRAIGRTEEALWESAVVSAVRWLRIGACFSWSVWCLAKFGEELSERSEEVIYNSEWKDRNW